MHLTVSPITYVSSHSISLLGDIYLLHPHAINKVTKQRNQILWETAFSYWHRLVTDAPLMFDNMLWIFTYHNTKVTVMLWTNIVTWDQITISILLEL